MKHKPIFRLSLLALLLAGCGKDTTELPEGPETPATGGDAIVCRLSIGNEAPDTTDETRTAYGPLQDGYYPIYWRNADGWGSSARKRPRNGRKSKSASPGRPKAKPT